MSLYRSVYCCFWSDPEVYKWTDDERLLFLYWLTNEYTHQCGIYQIGMNKMVPELRWSPDKVTKNIIALEKRGRVMWNRETSELAIRNWSRYHNNQSEKMVVCVTNGLAAVKDRRLVDFISGIAAEPQQVAALDLEDRKPQEPQTKPKRKEQPTKADDKREYAEHVRMTEKEHGKLVAAHGEAKTKRMVDVLNNYKLASGKKYVSDYGAILNWVIDRIETDDAKRARASGQYVGTTPEPSAAEYDRAIAAELAKIVKRGDAEDLKAVKQLNAGKPTKLERLKALKFMNARAGK